MSCPYCLQSCNGKRGGYCGCRKCKMQRYGLKGGCNCSSCKKQRVRIRGGSETIEGRKILDTYRAEPIPASKLKFRPVYNYGNYGFSVKDQINSSYK